MLADTHTHIINKYNVNIVKDLFLILIVLHFVWK